MLNFSLVYVNISFFTSLLSLFLLFLIWRKRYVAGSIFLMLCILAVAVYNMAYALEYSSTGVVMKIFWSKWQYLGLYNILPFLFLFIMYFFGLITNIKSRTIYLLWGIPLAVIILAWTNEYHGLIWSSFGEINPLTNLMVYNHGSLYFLGIIYQYILGLVLLFILMQQWIKHKQRSFRHQIEVFIPAILLPVIGSLIYLSRLNPLPGMDWTPIGSFFSVVLVTLAITTFRFLDLIPVARDLVFTMIEDGIMVVDSQFRIIDWNQALFRLIPKIPIQVGGSANQIFRILGVQNNPFISLDDSVNFEVEIKDPEHRIIDIIVSPLIRNKVSDG